MDWDVFWSVLVVTFIVVPLFMIWGFTIADLFMRPDMHGFTKAVWLFGIIFFPVLGTILYFLTRPAVPMPRGAGQPAYIANTLTSLKALHDSGDLSDAEYERQRLLVLRAA
jgi:hypothetical protein